jgi:ubiquinone/menaquinone biosynthesis C-methylase UbiE
MDGPPDAYGSIARFYDVVLGSMTASIRSRAVQVHPPTPGMRVLDVGCGTGMYLESYIGSGAVCTGIDLSPAMLDVARGRLGEQATLELGDATNLPFADGSFDLVLASLFLHELDRGTRTTVIDEMARVVAAEGHIMVIDYRMGTLRWKGRLSRVFSRVSERVAGANHYRNWRTYLADGGLPPIVPPSLTIETEKVIAGGNLAIWLMAAVPD